MSSLSKHVVIFGVILQFYKGKNMKKKSREKYEQNREKRCKNLWRVEEIQSVTDVPTDLHLTREEMPTTAVKPLEYQVQSPKLGGKVQDLWLRVPGSGLVRISNIFTSLVTFLTSRNIGTKYNIAF